MKNALWTTKSYGQTNLNTIYGNTYIYIYNGAIISVKYVCTKHLKVNVSRIYGTFKSIFMVPSNLYLWYLQGTINIDLEVYTINIDLKVP